MKVFKQNNKLTIYLPFEVAKALNIGENDEVDFFRYKENGFIFMKKSDVAEMLMGGAPASPPAPPVIQKGNDYISAEELAVLMKLDTIRYPQRTKEEIGKLLNSQEKALLQQLIKKHAVNPFKKGSVELYGISKGIYDKFLMRKKVATETKQTVPKVQLSGHIEGPYAPFIRSLEENGFLIVQTEAEAGGVSLALEQSIRQGKVLGTRSFNKKFYIVTRMFFDMHNPDIMKAMRKGSSRTSEIAEAAGLEEEAARAILVLLAENGDVREKRKDYFALA